MISEVSSSPRTRIGSSLGESGCSRRNCCVTTVMLKLENVTVALNYNISLRRKASTVASKAATWPNPKPDTNWDSDNRLIGSLKLTTPLKETCDDIDGWILDAVGGWVAEGWTDSPIAGWVVVKGGSFVLVGWWASDLVGWSEVISSVVTVTNVHITSYTTRFCTDINDPHSTDSEGHVFLEVVLLSIVS
jgi:hypothetical protein